MIPDIDPITVFKGSRNSGNSILDRGIFENSILADELFAKALQSLETCVSVNNDLC